VSKEVVHYFRHYELHTVELLPGCDDDLLKYANEYGEVLIARIYGVMDHPRLGAQYSVRTSVVVKVEEDGTIETLNTIYKPFKVEVQDPV
jgi:uncharacterized protein with NRDE domain